MKENTTVRQESSTQNNDNSADDSPVPTRSVKLRNFARSQKKEDPMPNKHRSNGDEEEEEDQQKEGQPDNKSAESQVKQEQPPKAPVKRRNKSTGGKAPRKRLSTGSFAREINRQLKREEEQRKRRHYIQEHNSEID